MKYCEICKDNDSKYHDDIWDCINFYERKNNCVGKTMKNYISNLQKKEKVEYESAFSKWSKNYK